MTDAFELDYEELDVFMKDIVDMGTSFRRVTAQQLDNLGEYVRFLCRIELADIRYTGELERSFVVETSQKNMETRVYPTAKHGLFIRTGTRPHWAPIGPLKRWAAVKLKDENLAWAVQRSIATYGTSVWQERTRGEKSNPWPERVLDRDDFQIALRRTMENIGSRIVAEEFRMPIKKGSL